MTQNTEPLAWFDLWLPECWVNIYTGGHKHIRNWFHASFVFLCVGDKQLSAKLTFKSYDMLHDMVTWWHDDMMTGNFVDDWPYGIFCSYWLTASVNSQGPFILCKYLLQYPLPSDSIRRMGLKAFAGPTWCIYQDQTGGAPSSESRVSLCGSRDQM